MRLLLAIGIALTMSAGAALAQCPGCPQASGCASMSSQKGGLADLKLVNLTGDTVRLAEHIGMMPMVMLLAGTGAASAKAADVVQAAVSAQGDRQPMLVYVLAAGPKATRAFAKTHNLTGLVLVDQKKTALAAAMADTLPVALFINRSGSVVKADAKISEATVTEGVKALAKTEEKLIDPVCGMTVTKETAAGNYTYNGKTYYFCSKACKDNFTKDPQKYLAQ
jgi:YHS domain-containing protein